jgi:pimeloyl-ACP methyl ester carboxylesterase
MLPDLSAYEKYEQLTQSRLRYYEAGEGPVLLLLHGMGVNASADSFQFIFKELAEALHVIALDLPGFGKSDRVMEYGPTFDLIVDAIRQFIDKKALGQVDVLAHSAGAWFASILAYESPERIGKLALIGTAGLNIAPAAVASAQGKPTLESLVQGNMNSVYEDSAFTAEMAEEVAAQMLKYIQMPGAPESLNPLKAQMSNPDSRKCYLLQDRLPYIKNPMLMIWGGEDKMEPFPTWTEEWESSGHNPANGSKPWVSPDMQFEMIAGATHFTHWEHPDRILELVREFIS